MGVDINKVISFTFVIGAGAGRDRRRDGRTYYGIAHYQMGFLLGLKAFSAAVLGGIGNLAGAVLGGSSWAHQGARRGVRRRLHQRVLLDVLPDSRTCASPESSLFGQLQGRLPSRPHPRVRIPAPAPGDVGEGIVSCVIEEPANASDTDEHR
jgi:hypothetical protein